MCNGNNHLDDCECGFGPPYDRDVPDYFDQRVGSEDGKNLTSAGPRSAKLGAAIADDQLTTQLVSTFLWQSYIGRPSAQWVGRASKAKAKAKGDDSLVIYVVRRGKGYPRHDLLIFDPQLAQDTVEQGYVDTSPAELRAGWRNFSEAYAVTNASIPRWLSSLNLQDVPEIANEAMVAQRHFFIAMHPPRLVWTSGVGQGFPRIASPALAISKKAQGKTLSTGGVIAADDKGRTGVTTALHALNNSPRAVFVKGLPGNVRVRHTITDSCFIEMERSQLPPCPQCSGPLRGVTPGRGETVWFEGVTSGKKTTHVDGWTIELPWPVPWAQSRIITPAVTDCGDSGAALVNRSGEAIGFAFYRTGFNSRSPHSAWIWAESVFSALHLQ